jgi:hypothetical protein
MLTLWSLTFQLQNLTRAFAWKEQMRKRRMDEDPKRRLRMMCNFAIRLRDIPSEASHSTRPAAL